MTGTIDDLLTEIEARIAAIRQMLAPTPAAGEVTRVRAPARREPRTAEEFAAFVAANEGITSGDLARLFAKRHFAAADQALRSGLVVSYRRDHSCHWFTVAGFERSYLTREVLRVVDSQPPKTAEKLACAVANDITDVSIQALRNVIACAATAGLLEVARVGPPLVSRAVPR